MSPHKSCHKHKHNNLDGFKADDVIVYSGDRTESPPLQQATSANDMAPPPPKVCAAAQSAFELLNAHRHSEFHQSHASSELHLPSVAHTNAATTPSLAIATTDIATSVNTSIATSAACGATSFSPRKKVCFKPPCSDDDAAVLPENPTTVGKIRPLLPPAAGPSLHKKNKTIHSNVRTFGNHSSISATGLTTTLRGARRIEHVTTSVGANKGNSGGGGNSEQHLHRYDFGLVYTASNSSTSCLSQDTTKDADTGFIADSRVINPATAAPAMDTKEESSSVLVKYLVRKPIAVARALTSEVWETFSPQSQ